MNTLPVPATDPAIVDAAVNAAAVASIAYQLELERLRYVITLGLRHGATVQALAAAAGLTCDQIATLVNQGEL